MRRRESPLAPLDGSLYVRYLNWQAHDGNMRTDYALEHKCQDDPVTQGQTLYCRSTHVQRVHIVNAVAVASAVMVASLTRHMPRRLQNTFPATPLGETCRLNQDRW